MIEQDCLQTNHNELMVQYWVDAQCKIVRINWDWSEFSLSNNTHNLTPSQVLGRDLGDFICDDTTRMLIYTLVKSVHGLGRPMRRPYRCDSPECKRFMEMEIAPEPNGLVRLDHRILRVEPLPVKASFHLVEHNTPTITVPLRCSMCNCLKFGEQWIEIDMAIAHQLIDDQQPMRVIYTICPTCKATMHFLQNTATDHSA